MTGKALIVRLHDPVQASVSVDQFMICLPICLLPIVEVDPRVTAGLGENCYSTQRDPAVTGQR